MLYNETLDIISLSDNNKTSDSCIVYCIVLQLLYIYSIIFCVFNNKYIYGYLRLFLSLFKK